MRAAAGLRVLTLWFGLRCAPADLFGYESLKSKCISHDVFSNGADRDFIQISKSCTALGRPRAFQLQLRPEQYQQIRPLAQLTFDPYMYYSRRRMSFPFKASSMRVFQLRIHSQIPTNRHGK